MKLEKVKNFFGKFLHILARRAFLTCLIFIFLALVFGGIMYYKYDFLVQKFQPQPTAAGAEFKEKVFEKVLIILEERQVKFEGANQKIYQNIFKANP